jgi:hypothetical protein
MAREWRRNGVKGAWLKAGLAACAACFALIWLNAQRDALNNGPWWMAIAWELPTLAVPCILVQWWRHMKQFAAANMTQINSEQAVDDDSQPGLPGIDDAPAADEWESCSLEGREHG